MKIPKKLKIGAHIYNVKLVDELDKCGMLNRDKNILSISADMPQDQKEATLIHEILHGLNNELDHTLVDGLAEGLYQVFKDNDFLK